MRRWAILFLILLRIWSVLPTAATTDVEFGDKHDAAGQEARAETGKSGQQAAVGKELLLAGVPADATAVLMVDLSRFRLSPYFVDYLLQNILALEPLTSEKVQSISVSALSGPENARTSPTVTAVLKHRVPPDSLRAAMKRSATHQALEADLPPMYRLTDRFGTFIWVCMRDETTLACAPSDSALRQVLEALDKPTERASKLSGLLKDYADCPVKGAIFCPEEARPKTLEHDVGGKGLGRDLFGEDSGRCLTSGAFGIRPKDEVLEFEAWANFESVVAARAGAAFLREKMEKNKQLLHRRTALDRAESASVGAGIPAAMRAPMELLEKVQITHDGENVTVNWSVPGKEFQAFFPMFFMVMM